MSTALTRSDILIAGGSFAGLALATALAHEANGDLAVTVVAPAFPIATPTPDDIRASALSRASLHLLDHLGIWADLAPHCETVTAIEITDSALHDALRPTRLNFDLQAPSMAGAEAQPRGRGAHDPFSSDPFDAPHGDLPRMVIVENHHLAHALYTAASNARGVTLIDSRMIETFTTDADAVRATLDNGDVITSHLLAAADGGPSRLRDIAGIRTVGRSYGQSGIIAIVEPELPHLGHAVQHFLPSGPFALLPMVANRICITWSETTIEARRILALDPASFRAEVMQRFGGRLGALKSISAPRAWPLTIGLARSLVSNRFALVGDAAHRVHPLAGQGINLGFRDVAALTETIVDAAALGLDIGAADALERYERWRRFDNLVSATGFDLINRAFSTDSTLLRSARGAALSVADRLPALKSWFAEEAAGTAGDIPRLLRQAH